jgi:hypothetical protein
MKFSLKQLILFVTIAAVAIGVFGYHSKLRRTA